MKLKQIMCWIEELQYKMIALLEAIEGNKKKCCAETPEEFKLYMNTWMFPIVENIKREILEEIRRTRRCVK